MTRSPLLILSTGLVLIFLTGCSSTSQPAPDDIMTEVGQQLANLSSAQYQLNLDLKGSIPSSFGSLDEANVKLSGQIIGASTTLPNYSVLADVTAQKGITKIHLGGQMVALSDFTYFQLTDLSLPSLLPISLGADKKWYKISTDDAGELPGGVISPPQIAAIQNLIQTSHPFEVTEVLPVTTVNGVRALHYKTQVNPSQLRSLIIGIDQILGTKSTPAPLDYLGDYQPEIFVGSQSHQLLEVKVAGLYLKDNLPMSFNLDLSLNHQNQPAKLAAPSASENLDSSKLFKLPKLPF